MTTFRQIEANRRNARLSTGPTSENGKRRSRRNAVRHGLTAETVIDALEDAADYAAFELAITADYEPQSAVERELVLRLASLLWRLRRATSIESGLFNLQAQQQLPASMWSERKSPDLSETWCSARSEEFDADGNARGKDGFNSSCSELNAGLVRREGVTRTFVQLSHVPACPLDRISRYESSLWRQAGQTIFMLQLLQRRGSWKGLTFRPR